MSSLKKVTRSIRPERLSACFTGGGFDNRPILRGRLSLGKQGQDRDARIRRIATIVESQLEILQNPGMDIKIGVFSHGKERAKQLAICARCESAWNMK